MDLKGIKFIARCESRMVVQHQDKIDLTMNLNQMHLFDAQTTQVVY
jgi:multiple sugar transport system ATP-binding protein